MKYSFIIPVYNRPEEIDELLQSIVEQQYNKEYEVVIIEDGSTISSQEIVKKYRHKLNISYYPKANSGPGDSRNYGMQRAQGNYFIILDSDCILPPQYLQEVDNYLENNFVDCFGGPDTAHYSFSNIQKAINIVMTSVLTTAGIRGASEKVDKFQPRSFNMGLSKKAFEASKGFGNIHPGEDPELSIKLWEMGYKTALISKAFVYHKRRVDWKKFYTQVKKFGKARPILNAQFPKYSKITYWFPSLFIITYMISILLLIAKIPYLFMIFLLYFGILYLEALTKTKSFTIAAEAIIAVHIQFFGYGIGFLYSTFLVQWLKKDPKQAMPEMFFTKK